MFSFLKMIVHILAYGLSKSGTFFNFEKCLIEVEFKGQGPLTSLAVAIVLYCGALHGCPNVGFFVVFFFKSFRTNVSYSIETSALYYRSSGLSTSFNMTRYLIMGPLTLKFDSATRRFLNFDRRH